MAALHTSSLLCRVRGAGPDWRAIGQSLIPDVQRASGCEILLSLASGKVQEGGCTYTLFYCSVLFKTKERLALKAKYTLFMQHEPPLGWKHRILITFYKCFLQTRLQAGQGYGNTLKCVLTVYRNESVSTSSYVKYADRKSKSINR